jgi:penicillin-binding protein-related factor A (putative recombinase)
MPRMDAGVAWEKALGRGLKFLPGNYSRNANALQAECDFFGSFHGLSWRVEAKETKKPNLAFSVLSKNQRKILAGHHNGGGLGLILVRYVGPGCDKGGSMYGLTYSDFIDIGGTTRPGSISLFPEPEETLIPLEMVEKFENGKSVGKAVDLSPLLEEGLRVHYDALTGLFEGFAERGPTRARSPKRHYTNQPPTRKPRRKRK